MKLSQVSKYNVKKLQSYRQRSLYLLIPVTFLLILGIGLTSQTKNIQSAINQSVFGTIEKQGTLIQLQQQSSQSSRISGGAVSVTSGQGAGGPGGNQPQTNYTSTDIEKIKALANVTNAEIVSSAPLGSMSTTDLFPSHTVSITGLTGLDSSMVGEYTDDAFTYTAGQPIPIVLNANQFTESYEDWGGQTSITTTFTRGARPSGSATPAQRPGPEKSRALTYDKSTLLGKTFTASLGTLSAIQDYSTSFTTDGLTFTKLTADQIAQASTDRQTALSPYWDYTKLSSPLNITFKVVGIVSDTSTFNTYIPEDAVASLMHNIIQKQLDARTSTAIPTTDLNQTFTGITYDGLQLQNGQGLNFGGRGFGGAVRLPGTTGTTSSTATTSYQIPGLVIQTDRTSADTNNPFDRGTVQGVDTDPDVYKNSSPSGSVILIKINNIYNRQSVVDALNGAGYAFEDSSQIGTIDSLKSRLDTITTWFIIAFVLLTALIMAGSLSRFVSDSRREIGIFRALGATKNQIRTMFIGQAALYGAIAAVIGVALGLIATRLAANPMHNWFSSFVDSSLRATYPTITTASSSVFNGVNWQGVGILVGILFLVTVLTAVFTASNAARVSPAEAIKRD